MEVFKLLFISLLCLTDFVENSASTSSNTEKASSSKLTTSSGKKDPQISSRYRNSGQKNGRNAAMREPSLIRFDNAAGSSGGRQIAIVQAESSVSKSRKKYSSTIDVEQPFQKSARGYSRANNVDSTTSSSVNHSISGPTRGISSPNNNPGQGQSLRTFTDATSQLTIARTGHLKSSSSTSMSSTRGKSPLPVGHITTSLSNTKISPLGPFASTSTTRGKSPQPFGYIRTDPSNARGSSHKSVGDITIGPAKPPWIANPSELDPFLAEKLLLKFGVSRRMWSIPRHLSNKFLCSVREDQPIIHDFFKMKNIVIPVEEGIFQVKPVEFIYHPNIKPADYVLLQCSCEIIFTSRWLYIPANNICVNGKIHLLKGASGPNSFFVFSFDPKSIAYNVLTHITVFE